MNVLEDPDVRSNLPHFSNWPTFPQLFICGELIGGCDIMVDLQASGELQKLIAEAQTAPADNVSDATIVQANQEAG